MPTFSHIVKVSVDDNLRYTALIEGDDATGRVSIFIYNDPYGQNQVVGANWDIDDQSKTIAFDAATFSTSLNVKCIIACMVGAGAPFAVCVKKAKNKKEVWKCIDEHSQVAGITAIACVVGCM